jgi:hypothetical protein
MTNKSTQAKSIVDKKTLLKILKKKAKKGDVLLVGGLQKDLSLFQKTYYKLNRKLYGNDKNIHTGLYLGKGKTLDVFQWSGVKEDNLNNLVGDRKHITILRPKLSSKEIAEGVEKAKEHIEKKTPYATRNTLAAYLKEKYNIRLKGLESGPKKVTCTSLIARSFPKLRVAHRKKSYDLVTPMDYRRSPDYKHTLEADLVGKNKYRLTKKIKTKLEV